MINYNYLHLSPVEFEDLSRDILQIRENLQFESFNSNKDGGIDFRHKTDESCIVIQAKRYQRYSDLKKDLIHKEVAKIQRAKPSRYILVTSVDLTIRQKEDLIATLKGYILYEKDILGRRDLDNLLGQVEYRSISKKHYKLWLASTEILHDLIEQTVNRGDYNLAEDEWHYIRQECKFYVQNESFQEAVNKIEENSVVLISGTPGSGKTTLGRALVSYFQAKEGYNDLIYIRNIDHAWTMLKNDKKQIFFYDDFLGSINFGGLNRNEENFLSRFIERIKITPNKILIFTTREYVLRQAQMLHLELRKDLYQLSKCVVSPETYTPYIKAKILYNHLYFSGLHPDQILIITKKRYYESIVNHRNYTPRLIANYIEISSKNAINSDFFYEKFIEYLNEPNKFWQDIYEKQSTPVKALLITLFSLNEPVYLRDLKNAFGSILTEYTRKFTDTTISPETFENALQQSSDTFIRVELENEHHNLYTVKFQNPSIKDFLLEYLRIHHAWTSIVINGSIFLNQFIFAFSTKEEELLDFDADKPIHGKKIMLKGDLYLQFRNRFLEKFDSLILSTIEPADFVDQKTRYHLIEDLLTLKLIKLQNLFSMQDTLVRDFIITKFSTIITEYESKRKEKSVKILSREAMVYFPGLVKIVQPYITIDSKKLLAFCYDSITFTQEFIDLYYLGEIFPTDFDALLEEKGRKQIEKKIKEMIFDDVDYFESEMADIEVDNIFDYVYDQVFDLYHLQFDLYHLQKSDAFIKRLRRTVERPSWTKEEEQEWQAERLIETQTIEKTKKDIEGLFMSLRSAYSSRRFRSDRDLNAHLKKISEECGPKVIGRIKRNRHTFIHQFLDSEILVSLLVAYFKIHPSVPKINIDFWARMYDIISEEFHKNHTIEKEETLSFFSSLALVASLSGSRAFDKKIISISHNTNIKEDIFDIILKSEAQGKPFLFKTGEWFQFATPEFQIYLTAIAISKLNDEEKKSAYLKNSEGEIYSWIQNDNLTLCHFLMAIDFRGFVKYQVLPELEAVINSLDCSDNRLLVLSFCKICNPDFDFTIDENGDLEEVSNGYSCSSFFDILELLAIDFNPSLISNHIFACYMKEDEIASKKQALTETINYIKAQCEVPTDSGQYTLNMARQLSDLVFLELATTLGIVEYMVQGVNTVKNKMIELQELLQNHSNSKSPYRQLAPVPR